MQYLTVRTKHGKTMPIIHKETRIRMGFLNINAANDFLAGFARYYGVPAHVEKVAGKRAVTFRHGITRYHIIPKFNNL